LLASIDRDVLSNRRCIYVSKGTVGQLLDVRLELVEFSRGEAPAVG